MVESELTQVFTVLRRAGVRIANGNLKMLDLVFPETGLRRLMVNVHSAEPVHGHLNVLRRGSNGALEAAMKSGLDVVSLHPPQVVHNGHMLIEPDVMPNPPPVTHGKPAWVRWAVLRSLILSQTPMTQKMLADASGGTQQAVSNALKHFQNLVVHNEAGYLPRDIEGLVDLWLAGYPGPDGASTYWYSLAPVTEQVEDAGRLARELEIQAVQAGDTAADKYAPWRLPQTAELFVSEAVDFSVAGFSPTDRNTATMTAIIPADRTIMKLAEWVLAEDIWPKIGTEALADPLVVLWSLAHSVGPDAAEAAAVLRSAIEARSFRC